MALDRRLRLTEIFYSLQGESRTVGWPTVFIRLTGCPLRCVYCDTTYAFNGGDRWQLDAILQDVARYSPRFVTVTGGEPLAQPGCLDLLVQLADAGYEVSLETSGAFEISAIDPRIIRVFDLKTPDSGESLRNRYDQLCFLTLKDQVKFVIMSEADYDWACTCMHTHDLTARCEVLFSAAQGFLDASQLADWIVRDRLHVRFQLQLHKILWGEAQGK